MNTILEFFSASWIHTLGYTLLNSLWQALVIVAIVVITLRFIPTKLSNIRYTIGSVGMLTNICFSIGTFIYLQAASKDLAFSDTIPPYDNSVAAPQEITLANVSLYFTSAKTFIQSSMPSFVMLWIAGTLLFSLRILTGLMYVEKLKGKSVLLQNEWSERIQLLAEQLDIKRLVVLAESSIIQVPVVVGYFKPVILIPLGMCASLSTAQLETIFLHEIMHIRRKDYLINLLQVFVEAIYFFNPFVWIISGIIKREREHCCDDAVVQLHGSANEYVRALATLEEVRLSKAGLSLSLAENKNQLLTRIKRIMEKSAKSYSSRERIIPAVLLVIGLICASWVTNHTYETDMRSEISNSQVVVSDTTKKDKRIKKDKKAVAGTTVKTDKKKEQKQDETEISNGKDYEDHDLNLSEEFELDFALKFNQGAFPIPDVNLDIPMPDMAMMAPLMLDFNLNLEDLSDLGLSGSDEHDWEKFAKAFEDNFKSKFGDFYDKHGDDIQGMIEDAQQKADSKFDENWELKMHDFARKQEEWAKNYAEKFKRQAEEFSAHHEEQIRKSQEGIRHLEERHQKEFEKNHAQFEKRMKAFEEKNRRFEEELKAELIRDGYLGKDEKLEKMHWHNGSIEINGRKIKTEDEKKYNDIHKNYFKEPMEFKKFD